MSRRRRAAGDAHQVRFAFTVKYARALSRALLALERSVQALANAPFANLFDHALAIPGPLGNYPIDHRGTEITLVRIQQHLGMTPTIRRFVPPLDQTIEHFALLEQKTNHVTFLHIH